MKAKLLLSALILLALPVARGQGTAITYQGRLSDGSVPANGNYDLTFSLFAANAGGVAIVGPVTNSSTAVSNGLFTAMIDFGPGVFTGGSNWMEIGVRTNGAIPFGILAPRQQLTPEPYAIFANTASNLSGTVPTAQLTGTISVASLSGTLALAQLPAAVLTNNESSAVTLNNTLTLPDPATIFAGANTLLRSDFSQANFFAGPAAGNATMTGNFNTGSGRFALLGNTSGLANTADGANALFLNTSGSQNTAVGGAALAINSTGQNNSAFGAGALANNTTGSNNAAVGGEALQFSTGANNIAVGYLAGHNLTTGSNNIDIGSQGVAGESSVIRIGNPGDQTSTFIAGTINGDGGGLTNLNPSQFTSAAGITIQQNPGSGAPNVIEGSQFNFVAGGLVGATIGGGGATNFGGQSYTNSVIGVFGTVSGGRQNTANYFATVGGGDGNTAKGYNSTVGGGTGNTASGDYSTVAGGSGGIASGAGATVGGGNNNYGTNIASGEVSTIGGGSANIASADWTTVAGGVGNTASAFGATVGGGALNSSLDQFATIAGGQNNNATNLSATVGGGNQNIAGGKNSTVPGGIYNSAFGNDSFAAGTQAKAMHQGAFVWADSQSADFLSTTNDQFLIRAQGGVGINTNNPHGASLYVKGSRTNGWQNSIAIFENTSTATNAAPALRVVCDGGTNLDGALSVSSNGKGLIAEFGNSITFVVAITNDGTIYSKGLALTSDRNAKENFTPLDTEMVLAKIAAMPVTEWNYKDDGADKKHIGPVAQDFSAAFGLNGGDDTHISIVDEGGVALAAIKGLNQKVEEGTQKSDARIQKLEAENAELRNRLARIEQFINEKQPISSSR